MNNLIAKKSLSLPDGSSIVLIDMMGRTTSESWDDSNRNIYRLDAAGKVIWRIDTMSASDEKFPYTNIYLSDTGALKAYCWDGGEYDVDVGTGEIDHGRLSK
jgi:hypothetical protein